MVKPNQGIVEELLSGRFDVLLVRVSGVEGVLLESTEDVNSILADLDHDRNTALLVELEKESCLQILAMPRIGAEACQARQHESAVVHGGDIVT
jgi:hypothetical protein